MAEDKVFAINKRIRENGLDLIRQRKYFGYYQKWNAFREDFLREINSWIPSPVHLILVYTSQKHYSHLVWGHSRLEQTYFIKKPFIL